MVQAARTDEFDLSEPGLAGADAAPVPDRVVAALEQPTAEAVEAVRTAAGLVAGLSAEHSAFALAEAVARRHRARRRHHPPLSSHR